MRIAVANDYRHEAGRPSLSPLLVGALSFWAACACAYGLMRQADPETGRLIALACLLIALPSAAVFACTRRQAALFFASLAIGASLGVSQGTVIHDQIAKASEIDAGSYSLTLVEDSKASVGGDTALASLGGSGLSQPLVQVTFPEGAGYLVGDRIVVEGTVAPIDVTKGDAYWRKGACAKVRARTASLVESDHPLDALRSFRKAAIAQIGSDDDSSRLLQALLCGYRRDLADTELYSAYQTSGLAHLVAVSGAHLVIVTGLFLSLFKAFKVARRMSAAFLIAVMLAYLSFAGFPVSAVRAAIMSSVGVLALVARRRPSSLNAVGICIFAMVLADPKCALSASFCLSTLSTLGIVVFCPLVQAWVEKTPLARVSFVAESLSLTVSASALSQLFACSLFAQLPAIAPVANVLAAPLLPLVCASGLVACVFALAFPIAREVAFTVPLLLARILNALTQLLACIPYSSVPFDIDALSALLVSAVLAMLAWRSWPMPAARAGKKALSGKTVGAISVIAGVLLAASLGYAFCWSNRDAIVMLDVGQGDSFLIASRGATLLIDTGNQDAQLLRGLSHNRIAHIDSVLITHSDDDHCGSLDALQRAVDVDRVIVAEDMIDCEAASPVNLMAQARLTSRETVGVHWKDTFRVGAFLVRVVWPHRFHDDGGNADSLCVLLEYDGDEDGSTDCRALFTGDAEIDQLQEMIDSGDVGHVDLLKTGHHGSKNAMTREQVEVLQPQVALIGVGANNRYGHPSPEILDMLGQVGCSVYRSDENGEVSCTLGPFGISVASME